MILKEKKNIPLFEKYGLFTEAPKRRPRVINVRTSRARDYSDDIADDDSMNADNPEEDGEDGSDTDSLEPETEPAENAEAPVEDADTAADNDVSEEESPDDIQDTQDEDTENIEVGDSSEEEDYTDSIEDDESTSSDDGGDGENTTSDTGEGDAPVEDSEDTFDKNDMRKFKLYKRFIELHSSVEYFVTKLESIISDDESYAVTVGYVLRTLKKVEAVLRDYMVLKYQSDSNIQNIFFFEKVKATVLMTLELLRTNKICGNTETGTKH